MKVSTNVKALPVCESCPVKECFVKECNVEWLIKLGQSKSFVSYKKGDNIIYEGQAVHGMYFIYSGKVKVLTSGYDDKKQTVRLAKSGEILGHMGYSGEFYPIGASALEDSGICFVENELLYNAFMNNPKFTFLLMMYYSRELRKTESRMKGLAQMTVMEKVADALILLNNAFGKTIQNNKLIDVKLERKEIADIAGINPEQAIRALSDFKKQGLIGISRKVIILKQYDRLIDIIRPYYHNIHVFYS